MFRMENKPYLRTILGGTDFQSLSLIQKIVCISVVLLWLGKHHAKKLWNKMGFKHLVC